MRGGHGSQPRSWAGDGLVGDDPGMWVGKCEYPVLSVRGTGDPTWGPRRSCVLLPFQDCSSLTEIETGQDQ